MKKSRKKLSEKQLLFLKSYSLCFNKTRACNEAGINRKLLYDNWLKNEVFREKFDEVYDSIYELAQEAWTAGFPKDWKAAQAWIEKEDKKAFEADVEKQKPTTIIIESELPPERLREISIKLASGDE